MSLAEQGIASLMMHVDSLIVIPNERLKLISQERITLMNAFEAADNVLRQGVESISSLINIPAFINLDFADVRSIMKDAGFAHMGVGVAKGAGKAENAAKAAISSPLLETSIAGARGVIINITSSPDIGLDDVETAASMITQSAHPDANIIWGTAFDERLSDEMSITVVATGFREHAGSRRAHPGPCGRQACCRCHPVCGGCPAGRKGPARFAGYQPGYAQPHLHPVFQHWCGYPGGRCQLRPRLRKRTTAIISTTCSASLNKRS